MSRIASNQSILGGVPCIEGTRMPAKLVANLVLRDGMSINEVIDEFDDLTSADVRAAIEFVCKEEK